MNNKVLLRIYDVVLNEWLTNNLSKLPHREEWNKLTMEEQDSVIYTYYLFKVRRNGVMINDRGKHNI